MYYRIANQRDASSCWEWESRVIVSFEGLFPILWMYRSVPRDYLRVFFSSSVEGLDLMLDRENKGLPSNSITAEKLLNGNRKIRALERMGFLDRRRLEVELGAGGDHDIPYTFTLPTSLTQTLAWLQLLAKGHHEELQP